MNDKIVNMLILKKLIRYLKQILLLFLINEISCEIRNIEENLSETPPSNIFVVIIPRSINDILFI